MRSNKCKLRETTANFSRSIHLSIVFSETTYVYHRVVEAVACVTFFLGSPRKPDHQMQKAMQFSWRNMLKYQGKVMQAFGIASPKDLRFSIHHQQAQYRPSMNLPRFYPC